MIAAVLLAAACVPLPTCTTPTSTNCATPSAVLRWDPVADKPPHWVKGYRVYYRFPGGTWQLVVDLPCAKYPDLDEDGIVNDGQYCPGADAGVGYAVQRFRADELVDVEYAVKAYDDIGALSPAYSDVISICPSHVWQKPEVYQ